MMMSDKSKKVINVRFAFERQKTEPEIIESANNGWSGIFYWRDDFYKLKGFDNSTIIRNNNIHHNRRAVFVVNTDISGQIIVKDNVFTKNGGNPIHYEYYEDYDMSAHTEDWDYNKKSEILILKNKEQMSQFKFGENVIDGKKVFSAAVDKFNK